VIEVDIYGKPLSSDFIAKASATAQKLKPKVVAVWLESKHNENLSVSVDSPNNHASTAVGDIGYYFTPEQAMNSFDRQSFTWAVAGAKDFDGKVIRADGSWYTMPSDLSENYEFGWWSGSVSTSNANTTYGGYSFANNPTVTFNFDSRPCNLVRVSTSEFNGPVHTYKITVRSSDSGAPNPLYTEIITIPDDSYYYDHFIPPSLISGNSNEFINVNEVEIEVITTKNPLDYARLQEVNVIFESDVSDDIISLDMEKTRDLHVTELPIAGGSSSSISISLDNTSKDYNIFNSSSKYGPYIKKNVKLKSTIGWQIKKNNDLYVDQVLLSNISSTSNTISIASNSDFPDGGVGNSFIVIIDPENYTREYVLVSSKSGSSVLNVEQRGFNNSKARDHSAGTMVRFETFEYPAFSESWVDEWSSDTDSMTLSAASTDWTKFASEKVITNGFFIEKAVVADAVRDLLLTTNFPKKKFKALNLYNKSALEKNAILHLNFSETVSDRSGTSIPIKNGLRSRFFSMPMSQYNKVKDITADALDRELSELEKALGNTSFNSADYTANSSEISSNTSNALDLIDFIFNDLSGEQVDSYYNMVFDGFYVPPDSGNQYLGIAIAHGGVRVFLEDILILDEFFLHPVAEGVYEDIQSSLLNLVAGKPYKIRIECFHTVSSNATDKFSVYLQYAIGSNPLTIVPASNVYTMASLDMVGAVDAPYTAGSLDRGKVTNNGIYIGEALIGNDGGLVSSSENFSVKFESGKYMRLPYDLSIDMSNSSSSNYTGEWSVEINVKPETGSEAGFSGDGDYISSFDSSTPAGGFEFYNNSNNGFKIKTSSGVETVSASGALPTDGWSNIVVTFDGSSIRYYLNGVLEDTTVLTGSISSWNNLDICFGGRNAYYLVGTGEVPPAAIRPFYADQFIIYRSCLNQESVSDRYTEVKMQPLTVYPFLYGNEASVRDVIEEITLSDLGRFYIDEQGFGKYEHFYAFFEPSIDVHANVQQIINDNSHIISSDFSVQLQTNKVVVKIAGLSTNLSGTQSLWRADDPTTLAVVNLESNIASNSTSISVSSTTDPPFYNAGYLIIDDEIVKYSSKTPNSFNNVERGMFGTTATSHTADSKVREVRYWDLKYDKAPAFRVKDPFITGIQFETPNQIDILKWNAGFYGAELIIAANTGVEKGSFVFAEGTNPLTEKVAYTAIAGIPVLITEQGSQIEEQVAQLSDNIRLYGLKEVVIENKFITNFNHGQKIADFIISKMSTPVPILNITTILTPKIAIGDRIKISSLDAFDIINGEYWVVSKSMSYSDSPSQSMMLRKVV
jgi:hypothetical protein